MTTTLTQPYRDILFQQFEKKKNRNVRYSLRAFARDLEVPVSRLSDVFSGKKSPSLPMAIHLASKLDLPSLQKELFIMSVRANKEKNQSKRKLAENKLEILFEQARTEWTLEQFEKISGWLDMAISVSMSLSSAPKTVEELAEMFEVSPEQVRFSVDRLIKHGELIQTENGWKVVEPARGTTVDVPSLSIKRFHCEVLEMAKKSIMRQPVEVRDFTSVIMSLNSQDVPLLKKRIAEMRNALLIEFGQSKDADMIYDLSLILFPVSIPEKVRKKEN